MEILKQALDLIKRNVSIVPVGKGPDKKEPYIKWQEYQDRVATEEEVQEWFKKWPDANIAIVTGKLSGLTIVDVESGGDISQYPRTLTVRSGGGGWHFYYQYHPIKSVTRIKELTDIKSDGGLCTTFPSIHKSGNKYEVLDKKTKIAPFPAHLFGEKSQNSTDIGKLLTEITQEGNRNNTATSICGKLLLRFREQEWETQAWPLLEAWNTAHNAPPLPITELRAIYTSIAKNELARRSSGQTVGEGSSTNQDGKYTIHIPIENGFAVFEFQDIDHTARSIETMVRCTVILEGNPSRAFVQRINILSNSARDSFVSQLGKAYTTKLPWVLIVSQACEMLEDEIKKKLATIRLSEDLLQDVRYLVHPFIEEGSSNIIFGAGSSGKTFLALRMALAYATGTEFLGTKPEKTGNILFIDYENTENVWARRLIQLAKGMELPIETIKPHCFYFKTNGAPIHDIKYRILEDVQKHKIDMVIIDSAALACGGEPESAEIANRLFNALNILKTTVLLIAHETKNGDSKNRTPFGSIFFYNSARNIWNVQKSQESDDNFIRVGMFHRKSNNDRKYNPKTARIDFKDGIVTVGTDINFEWNAEMSLKDMILDELQDNPLSLEDLVSATGKSRQQVKSRLRELKEKGIIVNPKRGIWMLNSATNQNTFLDG